MTELSIEDLFADVDERVARSARSLQDRYEITHKAEKGGNGYVFFGRNRVMDQSVAIKFYYWGGEEKRHQEPVLLARIKHPNVLQVQHAELIDDEWSLFVTAHHPGGDLDHVIALKRFSVHQAIEIASWLLAGLSCLHSAGLVHRDLKPGNILMAANGQPIIADFGSVKVIPQDQDWVSGSGHSVIYRPPESCASQRYSVAGDIYQCGLVLFQLLGGALPYDERDWLSDSEQRQYDNFSDLLSVHSLLMRSSRRKAKKEELLICKACHLGHREYCKKS